MKDQYFGLISKYALLLSAFFILSFIFSRAILEFNITKDTIDYAAYIKSAPFIFNFLLNLITAYIIGQDIKKQDIKTKYVLLSTIVYRPLGVVAFFLFILFQDKNKVETN